MSNFPQKEKKPLWTVYFRFTLKTNVRLFLFTWNRQMSLSSLGYRGDILIGHLSYTDTL